VRATAESTLARACLTLFLCLGLGLCLVPGFNVLNHYASLGLALPGSFIAAWMGHQVASDRRDEPLRIRFLLAARAAVVLLCLPLGVLLLNALRVKNCDIPEGIAFYLAGAGASLLFASQVGAGASLVAPGRWGRTLATVIVFGWVGAGALDLYLEPQIYAYNPFVGFFSGAVYDDVIELDARLGLYRLFNLSQLALFWAAAGVLWDPEERRLRLGRLSGVQRGTGVRLAAAVIACTGLAVVGGHVGFDTDRASIARQLGGVLRSERVIMHYDSSRIGPPEARRILADHHFHLDRLDATLGERYDPVIRSYVYADRAQKRRLMGARRVEVAKPWLREIHLTWPGFAASVVRHEIAHVVLGRDAPWPLNIPAVGRLIPHAALVEGAAEALEWSGGDLTLHQWSAALHRTGLAVDIAELMGPDGFYAQPPGKAYTLSGSFMRWLLDRDGPDPFRAVYRDADFERVYGEPLSTLVTAWRGFLETLELPAGAEALARQRYDRKAIFYRTCPLEIARLRARVWRLMGQGDVEEALETAREILGLVPLDLRRRLDLVAVLAHLGRAAEAREAAKHALSDEALGAVMRWRFEELLADAAWRAGDRASAAAGYAGVMRSPLGADRLRVVSVKHAIVGDAVREPVLGPYLMGPPGPALDAEREPWVEETLVYLTDAAADLPGDPLALYLLGRRLAIEQRYAAALGPLRTALGLLGSGDMVLPAATVDHVADEARRIEAIVLLHTGDPVAAAARFETLAARTRWPGRALQFREWAERARRDRALSLTP